MKKLRNPVDIKIGDYIFSKNDIEFNAKVIKIYERKVFVIYDLDGYGDETEANCNINVIYGNSKIGFEVPNWTF